MDQTAPELEQDKQLDNHSMLTKNVDEEAVSSLLSSEKQENATNTTQLHDSDSSTVDEQIGSSLLFSGDEEAEGLGWINAARGMIIIGGIFLATALLSLAENDAGCEVDTGEECTGRTYGIRPSSLLSLLGACASFFGAILMPLIGSVVDHTKYRREILIGLSLSMVAINYSKASISEKTYLLNAILLVINSLSFFSHGVVLYAYIPDIIGDPKVVMKFNANFDACRIVAMIFSLVSISILSIIFVRTSENNQLQNDIDTAQLAQIWVSSLGLLFFLIAFWKIKSRPILSKVPDGQNLVTASFRKNLKTFGSIWQDYPALSWYSVAILFIEGVNGSIHGLCVTFMVDFLEMDAFQVAVGILGFLLAAVFGSKTFPFISTRLGLLLTIKITTLTYAFTLLGTGLIINGPDRAWLMYPLVICYGFLVGSINPNERLIFVNIMPRGQEAEMMGFYYFLGYLFTFVPPLTFTIMSESGIGINWGIAASSIWIFLGYGALHMMGSYDSAVEHTEKLDNSMSENLIGNEHISLSEEFI